MPKDKIHPRWVKISQVQEYAPAIGYKALVELIENGDVYGVRRGKDEHYVVDLDSIDEYFEREKKEVQLAIASLRGNG